VHTDQQPVRGGRRPHLRQHSRGFNIVEILVALLVMAVGVIGIAALYADQVHADPEAQLHARAADLAEKIAARIDATEDGRSGFASTVGIICNPASKPALAHDIAAQEAACWQDEVESQLPSGLGTITRDLTTTPVAYVVAVSWSAPEAGAASYVIRVE
jgi:type IV pilus modification protein PilV